jgi:hypothetical protein
VKFHRHHLTATLDDATAGYLEGVAWELMEGTNRKLESARK